MILDCTTYVDHVLNRFPPFLPPNADLESQPTFWEFCTALIEERGGLMDDHWRPASEQCSLCHVEYDFILRAEDLDEEEAFMIRDGTEKKEGQRDTP